MVHQRRRRRRNAERMQLAAISALIEHNRARPDQRSVGEGQGETRRKMEGEVRRSRFWPARVLV